MATGGFTPSNQLHWDTSTVTVPWTITTSSAATNTGDFYVTSTGGGIWKADSSNVSPPQFKQQDLFPGFTGEDT